MAVISKVAVRYANALYSLAVEKGITDQVLAEMQVFGETYDKVPDFKAMLKSPVIRFDKKVSAIRAIFPSFSELTNAFVEKLTKSRREQYLGDIAKAYVNLYNARKGILVAHVATAVPLTALLRDRIKNIVRSAPGSAGVTEIILEEKVDPSMIGGYILTVGDKQIDMSFAHEISDLKRSFNQNLYIKEY